MNHPLQEHMMSNLIGHDIGDFCDLIVRRANAVPAPRSRPSDRAPTGLAASRFDRLSQKDADGD